MNHITYDLINLTQKSFMSYPTEQHVRDAMPHRLASGDAYVIAEQREGSTAGRVTDGGIYQPD